MCDDIGIASRVYSEIFTYILNRTSPLIRSVPPIMIRTSKLSSDAKCSRLIDSEPYLSLSCVLIFDTCHLKITDVAVARFLRTHLLIPPFVYHIRALIIFTKARCFRSKSTGLLQKPCYNHPSKYVMSGLRITSQGCHLSGQHIKTNLVALCYKTVQYVDNEVLIFKSRRAIPRFIETGDTITDFFFNF